MHTIRAIGVPDEYAKGTIRVSFGADNDEADAGEVARAIVDVVRKRQGMAPMLLLLSLLYSTQEALPIWQLVVMGATERNRDRYKTAGSDAAKKRRYIRNSCQGHGDARKAYFAAHE